MLLPVSDGVVQGVLHLPESRSGDGLVLTHGAGANHQAPVLVAVATAFERLGFVVLRFDLPFRQKRPHGPPPRGSAEEDQQGLRQAAAFLRTQAANRIFLGGHSYGGRQASMLAASQPEIAAALLLLSYPLHPPDRPTQMRTAHFPDLRTPALFVHGKRDGFCTHEELVEATRLVPARTEILEIEAAGHELLSKRNADALPALIANSFQRFIG